MSKLPIMLLLLFSMQTLAQSEPADTLLFINGERITGSLLGANSDSITFSSPMLGEIHVKWSKIKELRSNKTFAVLSVHQTLTRKTAAALVPQGTIQVNEQDIVVATSTGPASVPVAKTDRIVSATAFNRAIDHPPTFLEAWSGTANAGASLVRATQNATSFNGAVTLVRATPAVVWLPAKDRTTLDYSQSYGTVSQPGTTTIKTNIFHAEAERDQYLTPRLFAFASATFDHNFSQSLDLQQAYGGGAGVTLLRNAVRQLDLKADVHFEKQRFFTASQNQNLFGSTFSERYLQHLPYGLVFNEFGSVSPSWNNTRALSSHASANLIFPIYKDLGFNLGAVDDFLNDAPSPFKKNTTQFTTGIVYTITPR